MEGIKTFIYNLLNGSVIFNAVTLIIAVAGLIFSYYFYQKSKKNKIPRFIVRTICLIKDNIQKIKSVHIQYADREVSNISISKLALWNEGKGTIDSSDVAKNNPLRIQIDEKYEILDCEIIYQKNSSNGFSIALSEDRKSIAIDFDYFDYLEGIIVQIYHTGNSNSDLNILGQIKACKIINRQTSESLIPIPKFIISHIRKGPTKGFVGWMMLIVGIMILVYYVCAYFYGAELIAQKTYEHKNELMLFLGIFASSLYIVTGWRIVKRRVPKGFDIFDDEF